MMRLAISLGTCVVLLLTTACSCPAEIKAIERLDEQQEKLFKKYEAYVASDPKLDSKGKNDEMNLIKSLRDMMASIRKSLGD